MDIIDSIAIDTQYELDNVNFGNTTDEDDSYQYYKANILINFKERRSDDKSLTANDVDKIIKLLNNASTLKDGYLAILDFIEDKRI